MKNTILLFALLFSYMVFSQNYKLSYIVTDNEGDVAGSRIIDFFVRTDEKMAVLMVDMKKMKFFNEPEYESDEEFFESIKSRPALWALINYKDNIIYSKEIVGKKTVIEKDAMPIIKWNITKETKEIAGFECTKAIGYYRGRNWIAWFTPQIPISLGLLAKNGLPGLVLEVVDESGRYHDKIKSIEPTNETFDAEWNAYQNTIKGIGEIYTHQRVLEEREAYEDAIWNEMKKDRNVKLTRTKHRTGKELIYEWENEQEKNKYQSLNNEVI